MRSAKAQMLIDALEPLALSDGLELVDVEIVGKGSSPTIRIYLDGPEGIGMDELTRANRWVDEAIERIDPFPGAYMLEVSSPGIDRPLRTREHFCRFIGEEVVVVSTRHAEGGRSKWTGMLEGMQDDAVRLRLEDGEALIAFDDIKSAHVLGRVDFSNKSDEELFGVCDKQD